MKFEKRISRRFIAFSIVIVLLFGVLSWRLYDLQITKADQYQSSADVNRVKSIRLTGTRGMITDVNSVVLAMSENMYNVTFYRSSDENKAADYKRFADSILEVISIIEKNGGKLSVVFPIKRHEETGEWVFDFGDVSQRAIEIRESQWRSNHYLSQISKYPTAESCYEALLNTYDLGSRGLDEETILKVMAVHSEMNMNIYLSMPIVIAKDVASATVTEVIGRSMVLSGMDIEVGEKRVYPQKDLAAQVIGYVGMISESDNYQTDLKPLGYAMNDMIGKDGIEKSMENWLTPNISSRHGYRLMEKDSLGRLTREIERQEPENGNNVKLTINAAAQRAAEQAIAANVHSTRAYQEKKMFDSRWNEANREKLAQRDFDEYPLKLAETGVLIALEVKTGKVIAMAQYPTYDLNAMVAGGKPAADIIKDPRNVLRNYAIQSRAEPGSIFKIVPAMAALTSGRLQVTDRITDTGPFMEYTTKEEDAPRCWIPNNQRSDHADLDIVEGIQKSCNFFFYTIASRLYGKTGSNLLYKYAAEMGLSSKTGIQLPGEARSVLGSQTSLYDQTASLNEQETSAPILVAARIKKHLREVGSSYGIDYDDVRLDTAVKQLMDMAVNTPSSDDWSNAMRPILMAELNMTRDMVWKQATIGDIWIYLNDIKWGGSQEIQFAIGQSITLLTPVAVSRYVASLANGGVVNNLSIVDSITSPEGDILNQYQQSVLNRLEDAYLYLPYIKEGMKGVVDDGGTAKAKFKNWKYKDDIWAKTGTSQLTIGGIKLDLENNGWFVLLTPFETDAEIAVITHIPNGLSGAETTGAAKEFVDWWMANRSTLSNEVPVPVGGNELAP